MDLRRKLLQAKISKAPVQFGNTDSIPEEDDQPVDLESRNSGAGDGVTLPTPKVNNQRKTSTSTTIYVPRSCSEFFSNSHRINSTFDSTCIQVYTLGEVKVGDLTDPTSPNLEQQLLEPPVFVCHHGAGLAAASFSLLAQQLIEIIPGCGVIVFDARGHGASGDAIDFSLCALVQDTIDVIENVLPHFGVDREIVMLGHSLGGAVICKAVHHMSIWSQYRFIASILIDIVECTAIESLPSMINILAARPSSFASLSDAISWCVKTKMVRNVESACVSMPSLLRLDTTATDVYESNSQHQRWIWRTDLLATRPFWEGWFDGLTQNFITLPTTSRVLILTATESLDRDLTIAQMQGKFQLCVVSGGKIAGSSHHVHEEDPVRVAKVIHDVLPKQLNKPRLAR